MLTSIVDSKVDEQTPHRTENNFTSGSICTFSLLLQKFVETMVDAKPDIGFARVKAQFYINSFFPSSCCSWAWRWSRSSWRLSYRSHSRRPSSPCSRYCLRSGNRIESDTAFQLSTDGDLIAMLQVVLLNVRYGVHLSLEKYERKNRIWFTVDLRKHWL